jgi:hypothetical protein
VVDDALEAKTYLVLVSAEGIVIFSTQDGAAAKSELDDPEVPDAGYTEQPETVYAKADPPEGVATRIGCVTEAA